jgi:hypothetical protein
MTPSTQKSAFEDAINKNLQSQIDDEVKEDLFSTLDLDDWQTECPHTAILLGDAINLLKDSRFKELRNLLFQNRQPRITIFICAQDIFGIPIQIRRNCDTIWIFAGFTDKMMFGMTMGHLGLNGKEIWEPYSKLALGDALIVNYISRGTTLAILPRNS